MSLPLIRKPFVMQGSAITNAALMTNKTLAANEPKKIQHFHNEVNELSAVFEHSISQSKQKALVSQVVETSTTIVAHNEKSHAPVSKSSKHFLYCLSTVSVVLVQLDSFLHANLSSQSKDSIGTFNCFNSSAIVLSLSIH